MLRAAALVPLLVVVATACGSDGGSTTQSPSPSTTSSSPSPAAMTKAAWVAAVNQVCLDLEKETDKIAEPKTAQEFEDALKALVAALDAAQVKVRALAPPAEDAAEVEENFYAVNDAQANALREGIPEVEAAAEHGDDDGAAAAFGTALQKSYADAENNEKWMKDYGLTDCV